MKKLVAVRIEEALLDQIEGSKTEFIRNAIEAALSKQTQISRLKAEVDGIFNRYTSGDRHTPEGLLYSAWHSQCASSKQRGHPEPAYLRSEFIRHWLGKKKYKKMFSAYKKSGFDQALLPSFDRLDDAKGYSFDNIQLITWGEHKRLTASRNSVKVIVDGKEYLSISAAARATGINHAFFTEERKGKTTPYHSRIKFS